MSNEPPVTTDSSGRTRDASDVIELIIQARPRDLGGFHVRRALPSAQRRLVGPFIFFDHMGPALLAAGTGVDVRPHPHIALATVTYLFEGEIVHRDSLGSSQVIKPGDVNWMVAGHGIVHSERTALERRVAPHALHGIQAWVALPKAAEESAPAFYHHDQRELPRLDRAGVSLRVIAGHAYGLMSPVQVASPICYVDVQLTAAASLELTDEHAERASYVVSGEVACGEQVLREGDMAIFRTGRSAQLRALSDAKVMLLGGAALDAERHLEWNFVSSSLERIEQAKSDWRAGRFPKVPGDEVEFIPLP
jgi:redox-sensitive bicupin YhaK (pirin superfamily)